jgi:rod shape-determining protein MreC
LKDPLKWSRTGKALPIAFGVLACLVVLGFYPKFFEAWIIDPPLKGIRVVLTTVSAAFRGSTGLWGHYVALINVQKENDRLRRKVDGLERSLDKYKAMGVQNRRLMALLDLKSRMSQKEITCHVMADNPTNAPRTLLLDCGSNEGVKVRDGVIGTRGVVGFVVRVFSEFSQVLWIEDPMFALEGRLQEAGQKGLVRGRGSGHALKLQYVAALVPVDKGSGVVTTGEDGFFPPDEPIGRVVRSADSKHQMFRTIRLESAEKLDSLWVVFVLVPPHDWTAKMLLGRQGS